MFCLKIPIPVHFNSIQLHSLMPNTWKCTLFYLFWAFLCSFFLYSMQGFCFPAWQLQQLDFPKALSSYIINTINTSSITCWMLFDLNCPLSDILLSILLTCFSWSGLKVNLIYLFLCNMKVYVCHCHSNNHPSPASFNVVAAQCRCIFPSAGLWNDLEQLEWLLGVTILAFFTYSFQLPAPPSVFKWKVVLWDKNKAGLVYLMYWVKSLGGEMI